jgi:hypothetical protein
MRSHKSISQYSCGTPLDIIGAACNVPYTGGCYADYGSTGVARINGSYGSGNPRTAPYVNVKAFQNPAPFTFGNTPPTMAYGLRNPLSLNEDVSVGKDFHASDRVTVRFQGGCIQRLEPYGIRRNRHQHYQQQFRLRQQPGQFATEVANGGLHQVLGLDYYTSSGKEGACDKCPPSLTF